MLKKSLNFISTSNLLNVFKKIVKSTDFEKAFDDMNVNPSIKSALKCACCGTQSFSFYAGALRKGMKLACSFE